MNGDLVVAAFAVAAYAASGPMQIELPNARRISPAAAFGPAVAALVVDGWTLSRVGLLFAAAAVAEAAALVIARRPVKLALLHAFALFVSLGIALGAASVFRPAGMLAALLVLAAGSLAYYVAYVARQVVEQGRWRATIAENARATLPITLVMASGAGLIVLVLPKLGGFAFALMFVPVIAVRHEFARFGKASRTYDETVRALASLSEGAGYVPLGHHARVAEQAVAIGRELGLSRERLRALELVALLHDVGTVSLSDPSEVASVPPEEVARRSGQVLEETGYLADYAPLLLQAVSEGANDGLEARILRVADSYDQMSGQSEQRLVKVQQTAHPSDATVVSALEACRRP